MWKPTKRACYHGPAPHGLYFGKRRVRRTHHRRGFAAVVLRGWDHLNGGHCATPPNTAACAFANGLVVPAARCVAIARVRAPCPWACFKRHAANERAGGCPTCSFSLRFCKSHTHMTSIKHGEVLPHENIPKGPVWRAILSHKTQFTLIIDAMADNHILHIQYIRCLS